MLEYVQIQLEKEEWKDARIKKYYAPKRVFTSPKTKTVNIVYIDGDGVEQCDSFDRKEIMQIVIC